MSTHIKPSSMNGYLSAIVSQLSPFFNDIKAARTSPLVTRTLKGCQCLYGKPTTRKLPLSIDDIRTHLDTLNYTSPHDDLLFAAMLSTGTQGLLRLGEMTMPDEPSIRNLRKASLRGRVEFLDNGFSFWLQSHKSDKAFEGARIVILKHNQIDVPGIFRAYLNSQDLKFPINPFLWLTSQGFIPTRSWFMTRFRQFCADDHFTGQSMWAGGATFLAEEGLSREMIQATGHWSSEAFNIYIRRNPILLQYIISSASLTTPLTTS